MNTRIWEILFCRVSGQNRFLQKERHVRNLQVQPPLLLRNTSCEKTQTTQTTHVNVETCSISTRKVNSADKAKLAHQRPCVMHQGAWESLYMTGKETEGTGQYLFIVKTLLQAKAINAPTRSEFRKYLQLPRKNKFLNGLNIPLYFKMRKTTSVSEYHFLKRSIWSCAVQHAARKSRTISITWPCCISSEKLRKKFLVWTEKIGIASEHSWSLDANSQINESRRINYPRKRA